MDGRDEYSPAYHAALSLTIITNFYSINVPMYLRNAVQLNEVPYKAAARGDTQKPGTDFTISLNVYLH